jgi:glutathione S-transferase
MIELIQFPWSPFCLVQRRILEFSRSPFKLVEIPPHDRSLVWKLTRQRYYGVPVVKDGSKVIFETDEDSQVIAKYFDFKLRLDLFPVELRGLQWVLWRYIENEIEEMTFKLNDVYFKEHLPAAAQLPYLRHKERKFGRGCIEQWRQNQSALVAELTRRLTPFEEMLRSHPFLLDERPRFVDFDLCGMLDNFLFSGHYRLPATHTRLKQWHRRLLAARFEHSKREKLRP